MPFSGNGPFLWPIDWNGPLFVAISREMGHCSWPIRIPGHHRWRVWCIERPPEDPSCLSTTAWLRPMTRARPAPRAQRTVVLGARWGEDHCFLANVFLRTPRQRPAKGAWRWKLLLRVPLWGHMLSWHGCRGWWGLALLLHHHMAYPATLSPVCVHCVVAAVASRPPLQHRKAACQRDGLQPTSTLRVL